MPGRLVIRLGASAELSWLRLDERGRVIAGPIDGAPRADTLAGADTIVALVPGADVLFARTAVKARSREQLDKALPFALEDQLAEPVEGLHVAHVADGEGQLVAAVRRTRLRGWLDTFAQHGIRPDALIADANALPLVDGAITVLVEPATALLRAGAADCSAIETAQLAEWLELAAGARGASQRLRVALYDPDGVAPALPREVERVAADDAASALELLARGSAGPYAVNLLGGEFEPAHRGQPVRAHWRRAALLAAVVAFVWLASAIGETVVLNKRLASLQQQQVAVYREVFPDARNIPNPAGQMRAQLERAQSANVGGGGLDLLRRVAPVLTGNTQYSVKAIEYRNGAVDVSLVADSVATLDSVRERAAMQPGLTATLAAVSTSAAGTEGRLHVQGSAP